MKFFWGEILSFINQYEILFFGGKRKFDLSVKGLACAGDNARVILESGLVNLLTFWPQSMAQQLIKLNLLEKKKSGCVVQV